MARRTVRVMKKRNSLKKRSGAIGKKSKVQRKKGSRRRVRVIRGGRKGEGVFFDNNKNKVNLLIIDPQVDFHENGGLAVNGANSDSKRIASFITNNKNNIHKVFVSLDTHTPNHIGHPGYWKVVNVDGSESDDTSEPNPFTVFSYNNDKSIKGSDGKFYAPKRDGEDILKWTTEYVKNIESFGKGPALIWPSHCIEGTDGHKVTPVLREALASLGNKVEYHIKGQNELSEMYSIFKAEIPVPSNLSTKDKAYNGVETKIKNSSKINGSTDVQDGVYLNTGYNEELFKSLVNEGFSIAVCGEALSHCANWSLRDLVDEIVKPKYVINSRPDKIGEYLSLLNNSTKIDRERNKVIVLTNASSPVPGFGKNVDELMTYCKGVGVTVAKLRDDGNVEQLD